MSVHKHESMTETKIPVSARKGLPLPRVFPILPDFPSGSPLAIIDIDCDDRGDAVHTGTEMVFNTTKRMRLAKGAALLGEQGQYIELPARPHPSRPVTMLLTIARVLRIYRAKPIQTNWDVFFDPALLHYDQLNAGACEQIDSLEQAGWRILFLTSLPDTCFEVRKQQLLAAGLLKGESRGLICKPQAAQFLKTRHWKTLVISGTRVHHHMRLSDLEYRLLPDLLEFSPWMARGLLEHYRSTRLLFVDDEADNLGSMGAVAPWFLTELSFTLLGSLAQGVTLLQACESTNH